MTRPPLFIAMDINDEENEEAYSHQNQNLQNGRVQHGFFDPVE